MALERSPVKWCALEVFRRRPTNQRASAKDDTTVIVRGWKTDQRSWEALLSTVRGICRDHGKPTLHVGLIDGYVARFAPSSYVSYEAIPEIGSSLSVAGLDWASGTLRGYVDLCQAGKNPVHCALTYHHVLRPTRPQNHNPANAAAVAYDPALHVKEVYHPAIKAPDSALRVEQPSLSDHINTSNILAEGTQALNERLDCYREKEAMGTQSQTLTRGLEVAKEKCQEDLRLQEISIHLTVSLVMCLQHLDIALPPRVALLTGALQRSATNDLGST